MRGHLRRRGDAWELRAYAGRDPASGREIYRTRTYRGGKRDAEDALAKFVQEVCGSAGTTRDATVGTLVEQWFALAKADFPLRQFAGTRRASAATSSQHSAKFPSIAYESLSWISSMHTFGNEVARREGLSPLPPSVRSTPCYAVPSSKESSGPGSSRIPPLSRRRRECAIDQ